MIYKFVPPTMYGEVIAEVLLPQDKMSYLGLRYPSTDIPKVARQLYLINHCRLVYDVNDIPCTISSRAMNERILETPCSSPVTFEKMSPSQDSPCSFSSLSTTTPSTATATATPTTPTTPTPTPTPAATPTPSSSFKSSDSSFSSSFRFNRETESVA